MKKTIVLFAVGNIRSCNEKLTFDDRKEVWSVATQIFSNLGQSDIDRAVFFSSLSMRATQVAHISLVAFGFYSGRLSLLGSEIFEGPDAKFSAAEILNVSSDVIFVFRHAEILRETAQGVYPKLQWHPLSSNEALILSVNDSNEINVSNIRP